MYILLYVNCRWPLNNTGVGALILCMVKNMSGTSSWPSVSADATKFRLNCIVVCICWKKSAFKWTHAVQKVLFKVLPYISIKLNKKKKTLQLQAKENAHLTDETWYHLSHIMNKIPTKNYTWHIHTIQLKTKIF